MGIFGWSLPPGCGTLPGEEPEPSDLDIKRQRAGMRILREFEAENWGQVYRRLYKSTDCGVTVGVSFHSHDRPVYCDDLYKYGRDEWPIAVHVSSIVEGIDATTDTVIVDLDRPRAVKRLYEACDAIEKQADELWKQTHGCEGCAAKWKAEGVENPDIYGYVPVHPDCDQCRGSGILI